MTKEKAIEIANTLQSIEECDNFIDLLSNFTNNLEINNHRLEEILEDAINSAVKEKQWLEASLAAF
ncbi:MAG: hypothetical protein VZR36_06400 [Prevotella sp.]|nr:hypothetical protein [Prevotella sp.]